jgi:hypothetical protein
MQEIVWILFMKLLLNMVPYRISKNGSIGSTLKLNDIKKIVLENIAVVPSFFE